MPSFTSSGLSAALAVSLASSSSVVTFRSDSDHVGAGSLYWAGAARSALLPPSAPPWPSVPSLLPAVVPSSRCRWFGDLLCVLDAPTIESVRRVAGAFSAVVNPTLAFRTKWCRQARGSMLMWAGSKDRQRQQDVWKGSGAGLTSPVFCLCHASVRFRTRTSVRCAENSLNHAASRPQAPGSRLQGVQAALDALSPSLVAGMAPPPEKQAGKLLGLLAEGKSEWFLS